MQYRIKCWRGLYVAVEVIAGDSIGLFGSLLGVANTTALTLYIMLFNRLKVEVEVALENESQNAKFRCVFNG